MSVFTLLPVSLWAIGLTVYDKRAAHHGSWRVRERALLFVSLIGGSVAMIAAMCIIRRKTQCAKFMVGIPVIIILQVSAALFVCHEMASGQL
jgi:uncharacterized membrane protein YsdA (DUF1294 family)